MKFLSDTRHEELEAKEKRCDYLESQNAHLLHKCRELSAEVAIRKQNEHNREKTLNCSEHMTMYEEPDTGRIIRQVSTSKKTLVEPVEDSMTEEGRLSSRFHGFTSIVQEANTGC